MGTIITFVLFFIMMHGISEKGSNTFNNKMDARKSGQPFYWDGDNRERATSTDEIVSTIFRNGSTMKVGVHSGKVYYNSIDGKIAEMNRKAAAEGCYYYYQYFPQWKNKILKVDKSNNIPYITETFQYLNGGIRPAMRVIYLKSYDGFYPTFDYHNKKIIYDVNEFKKWGYFYN